jgi:nuclear pore complex protein Nup62
LDVRSIIQLWHKELAEDAEKFQEQAQRVSIWDNQLRENQRSLEDIVEGVHKLMATQQDLKSSIDSIEAYQNDLETELSNLSEDLDLEIEKMQLQEPTDDDLERERSYLLAEDLNHSLNQMESNIKKIVTDLNMKSDTSAGDASHPVAKVGISCLTLIRAIF